MDLVKRFRVAMWLHVVAGVDILTGGGVLRAESGSWCQFEGCIAYLMGAHVRPSVESMMT